MKTGFGFDVHKLTKEKDLILGGVKIPHSKGLSGVSDGDVILHSISDALLGALSKGDIGDYFLQADIENKGISSKEIIKKTLSLMENSSINNIDITVILEKPRLKPYKQKLKSSISLLLNIPESKVNLKIKSQENLISPEKECILCMTIANLA